MAGLVISCQVLLMRLPQILLCAAITFTGLFLTSAAHSQIAAPILSGITVEIADIVSFPDTRGQATEDGRTGANVARINFMREVPGSPDEWLVHDLRGQIYKVDPAAQQVTEFLDVGDEFTRFTIGPSGLSTGLNTVAFHPEFATNGKFYSIHSETSSNNPGTPDFGNLSSTSGHSVLTEWTAADPAASSFSGTKREVMRVSVNSRIHNLGDITFNPFASPGDEDYGMMYIAGGDSATGSPAQDLDSIFGKLLRIDPAGNNSANGAYGIPTENPWAADGDANTLGEVFAYGFRNTHRISWDLATGRLLGTDIGQNDVEEINFLEAGKNYGWNTYEGTFLRGGDDIPRGTDTSLFAWPAAQYDHDDGFAIAGGFVYRGTQIPELIGKFIYGDIVNGRLFYSDFDEMVVAHEDGNFLTTAAVYELFLTQDGQAVTLKDLIIEARSDNSLPNNRTDLRFGQTSDGEIYLSTKQDGWIRQLVGPGLPGDFDGDGNVDGSDFLHWQRGDSPIPFNATQLAQWQENYNTPSGANTAVPEPATWTLLLAACALLGCGRMPNQS